MSPKLGVNHGHLMVCPNKPNCVSSQMDADRHRDLEIEGGQAAFDQIRKHLFMQPAVQVMREGQRYIHAVYTTKLFGFADDLELYLDDDDRIQVRSASRVGYSDMNANRKRVEALREIAAVKK
ncbi:MAG: DUF1499 domain-containing protein [Gammaproteobacteria bacterium]